LLRGEEGQNFKEEFFRGIKTEGMVHLLKDLGYSDGGFSVNGEDKG
jgi:hypothetical protein